MSSIPLHRVAVIRPFADFLGQIGAPVERGFRNAKLPLHALEDADNFVPSASFWRFLVESAEREDIPDLGFLVGSRFGADSADPHMRDMLRRSISMYEGLSLASALTNSTVANCRMSVVPAADREFVYFCHRPSCEASHPANRVISWYGLLVCISMIRQFAGRGWFPDQVGVMPRANPSPLVREAMPDTRIGIGQPVSWVRIPKSMLALPPVTPSGVLGAGADIDYASLPSSLPGALRCVLRSYLGHGTAPNVNTAAELLNTSGRTLQRRLRRCGTSYSRVLDEARFEVARSALLESDDGMAGIARALGYSNPGHFSRAFRRLAGVSPSAFRRARGASSHGDFGRTA